MIQFDEYFSDGLKPPASYERKVLIEVGRLGGRDSLQEENLVSTNTVSLLQNVRVWMFHCFFGHPLKWEMCN